VNTSTPKEALIAKDLQLNPLQSVALTEPPVFLGKLHVTEDPKLLIKHTKDLIMCTKQSIHHVCGTTLQTLVSFELPNFVECAISPAIYYINANHTILKQQAVIAVCVLTSQPSLEVFQVQTKAANGERPLLTRIEVIPLAMQATTLSFFDKEHIAVVGESPEFKRVCFDLEVYKSRDLLNISPMQLKTCEQHQEEQHVYFLSQRVKDNCWADKAKPINEYEYLTDYEANTYLVYDYKLQFFRLFQEDPNNNQEKPVKVVCVEHLPKSGIEVVLAHPKLSRNHFPYLVV
jgi:hypothetical protein